MSVKRKTINVRHPDSDKLFVKAGGIEIDMKNPGPEDFEAMQSIFKATSDEGRAAFDKAVRAKTAELAQNALAQRERLHKPRRPKIDEWINAQIDKDPKATRDDLWERAPGWIRAGIDKGGVGLGRFKARVSNIRASRKTPK